MGAPRGGYGGIRTPKGDMGTPGKYGDISTPKGVWGPQRGGYGDPWGGYGDIRKLKGGWGPLMWIWGPPGGYGGIRNLKGVWGPLGGGDMGTTGGDMGA